MSSFRANHHVNNSALNTSSSSPAGAVGTTSDDGETSSVVSSVASCYRHHSAGPFAPPPPAAAIHASFTSLRTTSSTTSSASNILIPPQPKPVLSKDVHYKPKTTGSVGILVVGLGGANGGTLLAGILANRFNMNWYGPRGEPQSCNWYGCITQLLQKGHGVGYHDKVRGLADASLAAVGGWVRASRMTSLYTVRARVSFLRVCLVGFTTWYLFCDIDKERPLACALFSCHSSISDNLLYFVVFAYIYIGHSSDQTGRRFIARSNSRLRPRATSARRNEQGQSLSRRVRRALYWVVSARYCNACLVARRGTDGFRSAQVLASRHSLL
jgi:Myo-inositol-1-phosphate synthase